MCMVAALLTTACGGAASAAAAFVGVTANGPTTLTYCNDGGRAQTLDLYEPPAGGPAPHPLLIVVHGGSWSSGTAALDRQIALVQAVAGGAIAGGFAVASVNYRLAPADRWPAQIVDLRCAVRYLRATAARWHVDPRRFTALGESAGAQLVSLDALSVGDDPQWTTPQYAEQSSALQAVIDLWGPADLVAPGWGRVARGIGRTAFGVPFGSPAPALRTASPVTYAGPGAPPFLIIQGMSDALVPPAQSIELRSRLAAAGDTASLIEVLHAGHGLGSTGAPMSPSLGELTQRTVSWLVAASR
jgi:acetyl esterase/lipase